MEQSIEKLTVSQLVTKVPAFYATRRFILALQNTRHLPYTKPVLFLPRLITLLEDPFYYYTPNYTHVFQVVCSPRVSSPNPVGSSPDYITSYMPQSTLSL